MQVQGKMEEVEKIRLSKILVLQGSSLGFAHFSKIDMFFREWTKCGVISRLNKRYFAVYFSENFLMLLSHFTFACWLPCWKLVPRVLS